jgi:serine/threonine protein kinase
MQIGQKFYNYVIDALLESSERSQVYLAKHLQFDRQVRIKCLQSHLATQPEARQSLRQEAELLSQLQHQHILGLLDYFEDSEGAYLIQEHHQGLSLEDFLLQKGQLAEAEVKKIFLQILQALAFAHHKNIIHQHLAPAYIIVSPEGQVKVSHFGHGLPPTQSLPFLSPEQIKEDIIDKRSDIYALGVLLFTLLQGRHPYTQVNTVAEIQQKILHESLPPLENKATAWNELIAQATKKAPFQRLQSCEDFLNAFTAQNSAPVTPLSKEAKATSGLSILLVVVSLLVLTSTYFIVSEIFAPKEHLLNGEAVFEEASTQVADNRPQEEENSIIEESKEEEEAKSEEEMRRDSIEAAEKLKQEALEKRRKLRKEELLRNLLVDGQFVSNELGEYKIRVELFNRNKDAAFKDIVLLISYYNAQDEPISKVEKKVEAIGKSEGTTIEVKKEIRAARFSCKLIDATVAEDEQEEVEEE